MNEFEMKHYFSQLDTALSIAPDVQDVTEKEHELKIYTNWQEFNEALEKRKVYKNDEIHEASGDKYSVTEIAYYFEEVNDELKITPKYKYEKIK